jgi:hypothetical protein
MDLPELRVAYQSAATQFRRLSICWDGVGIPLILLDANKSSGGNNSANLVTACERSVRDQLLAAATAQFDAPRSVLDND